MISTLEHWDIESKEGLCEYIICTRHLAEIFYTIERHIASISCARGRRRAVFLSLPDTGTPVKVAFPIVFRYNTSVMPYTYGG